jgi:hypothetical protein
MAKSFGFALHRIFVDLDHLLLPNAVVRTYQYRFRDSKTQGLRRLEIDDQLDLIWLLNGQLAWFRAS